ncbi:hypothetical protein [Lignipirellula cremea]|uniref:Uncharacterized protein n=1 Tax=Lignipirellula cremea TaxID=2528010 RepID=A0A518DL48_9BACT|nr:hypothetical protein [Lignipirellula cremea]QDU92558.1 hypothetical protein Pla8534_03060 [Lignipirellula cremea]
MHFAFRRVTATISGHSRGGLALENKRAIRQFVACRIAKDVRALTAFQELAADKKKEKKRKSNIKA